MKKKLMALLLALAMVLALAACGGNGNAGQSNDKGGNQGSQSEDKGNQSEDKGNQSEDKGSTPSGPVTIDFWHNWGGAGGESLQAIVDAFNASQSDYVVTLTYGGSAEEVMAKYRATAIGQRPDLFLCTTENVAFLLDNPDYYVPVGKYVAEDNYDTSDIVASLRISYSNSEGELQVAPMGNTVVGFFYNADLLQAAGIDPTTDLESYDEILEACDKLQQNGVETPLYIPANSIYYTFPMTAEGYQYVDNNNGRDGLCTKSLISEEPVKGETVKYFKFVQDLQKKGQLVAPDIKAADARTMFADNRMAFYFTTVSSFNAIDAACNGAVNFGFHPAVTFSKGAKNYGQCTGGGVVVLGNNNDPTRERAAWEMIKFIMQTDNSAAFAMATGYLPTTVSGFNSDAYQAFVQEKFPTAKAAADAQQNTAESCFNAYLPMFSDFHNIVIEYTKAVINDTSYDPVTATEDFAAAVDECIELYALSKGVS